jgi:antitoxin (DNA-binding transcriptional repressor) of toxin-antitoxin stability system
MTRSPKRRPAQAAEVKPAEAKPRPRQLLLEVGDGETRIICQHCSRPFITVRDGQVIVISKHGSSKDENVLTLDHLRIIAEELKRQLRPVAEYW